MGESSFDRKQRALELRLDGVDVREPGVEDAIRADVEVAEEIGAFSRPYPSDLESLLKHEPLTDEAKEGLLIRARRDALATSMHSMDALRRLDRMEANLAATRTMLLIAAGWIFLAIVFGWRF